MKNLAAGLRLFLGAAVIVALLWHVNLPLAQFSVLGITDWIFLVTIGSLMLAILSLQFQFSLALVKFRIPYKDAFLLSSANSLLNLTLPFKLGLALRAGFMKYRYNFELKSYGFSLLLTQFCIISSNFLFAVVLSFFYFGSNFFVLVDFEVSIYGLIFFLGLGLVAYFFRSSWTSRLQLFFGYLRNAVSYKLITQILMSNTIFLVLAVLRLYLLAGMLDVELTLIQTGVIITLSSATLFFSLTPGNLGLREGLFYILAGVMGLDAEQVLMLALLDRVASALPVLAFGGASMVHFSSVKKTFLKGMS